MNQLPGKCPVCSSTMTVTRLQCGACGTGIDGTFGLGRLQSLTPEQVRFVEVFMKCKGKIKDVEDDLNISYPTVVARLNEVVKAMGYEISDAEMSEVDQYEIYEAQVLQPRRPMMPPPDPPRPMAPAPNVPAPPAPKMTAEQRQKILDDLAAGKISAQDAMKKIYG
jgi:hypothetical protein